MKNINYDKIYCYSNTDVLKNLMGVRDNIILNDIERKMTSIRISEIMKNPIKGNFDLEHLKSIHKYVFQDVYKWAGEIRSVDIKKGTSFCFCENIESYSKNILDKLPKEDYLLNLSYDSKLDNLVYYFSEINVIHPFREGNGRTQRIFIQYIGKVAGISLNFSKISKDRMIEACVDSVNLKYEKLTDIFKEISKPMAIKEQIDYIKNISIKDSDLFNLSDNLDKCLDDNTFSLAEWEDFISSDDRCQKQTYENSQNKSNANKINKDLRKTNIKSLDNKER